MVFSPTTVAQLDAQVQNALNGTLDTDTYGQPDTWDLSSITDWYSIDPLPFTLEQLKNIGMTPSQMKIVWNQLGSDIDGEAAYDVSGTSVSLSSDGTIMAIGADGNDGNGNSSGHVRVYKYNGSAWTQMGSDIDGEDAYNYSGYSVSLSSDGQIVAIGAYGNDGTGTNSGHVRVYQYNGSAWTQMGSDIDGEAGDDYSGFSVSLSSDGQIVAIGALYNDGTNGSDSGHVRVYQYDGTAWNKMGGDIDGEAAGDQSGRSVSLSGDGSIVAIGATGNNNVNGNGSGHVRVYQYNGSAWTQMGSDIDGEAGGDESGSSVSLSSNGLTVAIGSYFNDGNGNDSGHVRVYQYDGTAWTQMGQDIDGESTFDYSGTSVSLSSDGQIVAIGTDGNDGNGTNSGHVRVYQYDGSTWTQLGTDIDGEDGFDYSGRSVSLSSNGSIVAIGAYGNNNGNGNASGHVRVFNASSGFTAAQLKAVGFTAAELKAAEFDAAQLKAAGFDAAQLKAAEFDAAQLKAAEFDAAQLKAAAFTLAELKAAEFDAAQLKAAEFDAAQLKAAEFDAAQLKGVYTIKELTVPIFDVSELIAGGYTLTDLKKGGINAAELHKVGYSFDQLRQAGFSAVDCRNGGMSNSEIPTSGFSIEQLRKGGLSATRMRSAEYSAKQLYENGYAVPHLFQADYSASEIRLVGVNALEARFGGISNKEMKTAGYTVKEYKDASYQASRMKEAGYTREELKGIYSEGELDAAGY